MKPGESFFFNKEISLAGSVSFGIGWTMKKTESMTTGQAEDTDLDCAAIAFNEHGQVLDYVGYCAGDAYGMYCRGRAEANYFQEISNRPCPRYRRARCRTVGINSETRSTVTRILWLRWSISTKPFAFTCFPPECKCIAFVAFAYKR